MKRYPALILGLGLFGILAANPAQACGRAEVRFGKVETVSSFRFRSVSERDAIYRELAKFMERLGEKQLACGQSLTIDLIDVEPAGRFEPWRFSYSDVRVLTDTTPPSVKLRYVLRERGKVVRRGEETVTDLNYLMNLGARASIGSYPYEKETLRDWFRRRFPSDRQAAR